MIRLPNGLIANLKTALQQTLDQFGGEHNLQLSHLSVRRFKDSIRVSLKYLFDIGIDPKIEFSRYGSAFGLDEKFFGKSFTLPSTGAIIYTVVGWNQTNKKNKVATKVTTLNRNKDNIIFLTPETILHFAKWIEN